VGLSERRARRTRRVRALFSATVGLAQHARCASRAAPNRLYNPRAADFATDPTPGDNPSGVSFGRVILYSLLNLKAGLIHLSRPLPILNGFERPPSNFWVVVRRWQFKGRPWCPLSVGRHEDDLDYFRNTHWNHTGLDFSKRRDRLLLLMGHPLTGIASKPVVAALA